MESKKKLLGCLSSTLVWFDFGLYSFFGPIFSSLFFPHSNLSNLTLTYSFFALGYLSRPIGGFLFGYMGDKYGRIFSLKKTAICISFTTLILALLPTYKMIGLLACLLLLVTRMMQGIFLGGEFAGNFVLLYESSSIKKIFWTSLGSFCGGFGLLIASITASFLYKITNHTFMLNYGWRIAYLVSIPLGLIAFKFRCHIKDSEDFIACLPFQNPDRFRIKNFFSIFTKTICLLCLHATSFYFVFTFIPLFLTNIRGMSPSATLLSNSFFLASHLILIPIFGTIIPKFGGLKCNAIVSLIFIFTSIPLFYLICHGSNKEITIALIVLSVLTSLNAAIVPSIIADQIPMKIRYLVMGLSLNIGFGVFGGTMPVIGLYLSRSQFGIISSSYYLSFIALITFITSSKLIFRRHYEARNLPTIG